MRCCVIVCVGASVRTSARDSCCAVLSAPPALVDIACSSVYLEDGNGHHVRVHTRHMWMDVRLVVVSTHACWRCDGVQTRLADYLVQLLMEGEVEETFRHTAYKTTVRRFRHVYSTPNHIDTMIIHLCCSGFLAHTRCRCHLICGRQSAHAAWCMNAFYYGVLINPRRTSNEDTGRISRTPRSAQNAERQPRMQPGTTTRAQSGRRSAGRRCRAPPPPPPPPPTTTTTTRKT